MQLQFAIPDFGWWGEDLANKKTCLPVTLSISHSLSFEHFLIYFCRITALEISKDRP